MRVGLQKRAKLIIIRRQTFKTLSEASQTVRTASDVGSRLSGLWSTSFLVLFGVLVVRLWRRTSIGLSLCPSFGEFSSPLLVWFGREFHVTGDSIVLCDAQLAILLDLLRTWLSVSDRLRFNEVLVANYRFDFFFFAGELPVTVFISDKASSQSIVLFRKSLVFFLFLFECAAHLLCFFLCLLDNSLGFLSQLVSLVLMAIEYLVHLLPVLLSFLVHLIAMQLFHGLDVLHVGFSFLVELVLMPFLLGDLFSE